MLTKRLEKWARQRLLCAGSKDEEVKSKGKCLQGQCLLNNYFGCYDEYKRWERFLHISSLQDRLHIFNEFLMALKISL